MLGHGAGARRAGRARRRAGPARGAGVLAHQRARRAALGAVPWSLSLSSAGTILSAGARRRGRRLGAARRPRARRVSRVLHRPGVAGVASARHRPDPGVRAAAAPDGDWIALASLAGRAAGNLRQPNHLSSLLLWSVVAVVWLAEASCCDGRHRGRAGARLFIFVDRAERLAHRRARHADARGWGLLDRRLSRGTRAVLLLLAPVVYARDLAGRRRSGPTHGDQIFGGRDAAGRRSGDISSSRFGDLVEHAGADRVASLARASASASSISPGR